MCKLDIYVCHVMNTSTTFNTPWQPTLLRDQLVVEKYIIKTQGSIY